MSQAPLGGNDHSLFYAPVVSYTLLHFYYFTCQFSSIIPYAGRLYGLLVLEFLVHSTWHIAVVHQTVNE